MKTQFKNEQTSSGISGTHGPYIKSFADYPFNIFVSAKFLF